MTGRRVILGLIFAVGVLAPSRAAAEDAETQAKALLATYRIELKASRDISDDDGWRAFRRRLDILRQLGKLDCPRSRKGLLRVARSGKRLDDRLLAAQGVARSADLPSVRRLVQDLGAKGHPVLTQVAAEALGANEHADVAAWLAQAPAKAKSPGALSILLRAGRTTTIALDVLTALFDQYADKGSAVDLAYDAVKALGRAQGPKATARLLKAGAHNDLRLRLAAADVLPGRPRADDIDSAMRKLLTDDASLVRYAMLMALGKAKALHLLPEISERLESLRIRSAVFDPCAGTPPSGDFLSVMEKNLQALRLVFDADSPGTDE